MLWAHLHGLAGATNPDTPVELGVKLSYEQAVRKKACSLMLTEGYFFGAALKAAYKDPTTKERHFTTPLALYAKRSWPGSWGDWSAKGKGKNKTKTKGKDGKEGKGAGTTPEGDKICFRFNMGKCTYQKRKFLHVCNKCFKKGHTALNCRGGKGQETPPPAGQDTQGS